MSDSGNLETIRELEKQLKDLEEWNKDLEDKHRACFIRHCSGYLTDIA